MNILALAYLRAVAYVYELVEELDACDTPGADDDVLMDYWLARIALREARNEYWNNAQGRLNQAQGF